MLCLDGCSPLFLPFRLRVLLTRLISLELGKVLAHDVVSLRAAKSGA